ncbi:hypothetical protein M9H77_26335 [Catharanthus roseus]|uniref:Uncharacterized protein n=1 Tax=Catharanthus roseus TaxID=4058 RepID=A0ACC0AC31_CATRO|nr:hypothetical protein M9H77_26335 [Catharanthus roseus]
MKFMSNYSSAQGTSSTEVEEKTWNLIYNLLRETSDILPTGRNLTRHGLYKSTSCAHCGYTMGNDRYTLFDYRFCKEVWKHLPKGQKLRQIPSLSFKDLIYSISIEHSIKENKLMQEGTTYSKATIALKALNMTEEYLALVRQIGNQPGILTSYNWYMYIIRNHLGIPLLAKAVLQHDSFFVEFDELLSIIEEWYDDPSQIRRSRLIPAHVVHTILFYLNNI